MIERFGNEFNVLLDVPKEKLEEVTEKQLVELIMKNREGRIKIIPGYDGVYGKPVLDDSEFERFEKKQKNLKIHAQKKLIDFKGP